jgi:hypothetical protein
LRNEFVVGRALRHCLRPQSRGHKRAFWLCHLEWLPSLRNGPEVCFAMVRVNRRQCPRRLHPVMMSPTLASPRLLHPRIEHLWHEHESLNVGAAGCVACPCSIARAVWVGSSRAENLSQIASGDAFYAAFPVARTKGTPSKPQVAGSY